jgi:lipoprotein-anchoring transpeptidase ErfK/SrfK
MTTCPQHSKAIADLSKRGRQEMKGRLLTLGVMLMLSALMVAGLAATPIHASSSAVYVVQRGDTMLRIAARHGISVSQLARANGLKWNSWVYAGQRLRMPGSSSSGSSEVDGVHVVQRGESLSKIARRYDTTVSALARANGVKWNSWVYTGQRLRIPGRSSSSAHSANTGSTSGRWIEVVLSSQRAVAWEGNTRARTMVVSTGTSHHPTPTGRFQVYTKYASKNMSGPGYYLPGVPHTMFFYRDYAIHGTYWHNNFGHPMSHGCVNLTKADAAWLYSWASVGTPVVIHW